MLKAIYKYFHQHQLKGKDRMYSFLRGRNLPYKINITTKTNVKMQLDPKNYVDSFILNYGYYESEVLEALNKHATNNLVLWDIGANIGFHSLSFKKKFNDCEVIAFEPDYRNFEILNHHKKINQLDIKLMNFALSDKAEISELFTIEGNNGMSTLDPWHEFNWNKSPHSIACFSGDELIANYDVPAPDLIKLDVEGHELKVLEGLQETLKSKKVKHIIIEQPNNFIAEDSEIKSLLTNFGYAFKKLERKEPSDHGLSNFDAYYIN